MKITKEIVDMMLKANVKNRKVSTRRVEAIARAMSNGQFVPQNGQTIVITKSWTRLLDGQHRLLAMRAANAFDFDVCVVEVDDDKADEVFATIDIVRGSRSLSQIVDLTAGIPNGHAVVSLLSCLIKETQSRQSPCAREILDLYSRFESVITKMAVYSTCSIGKIRPRAAFWAAVLNSIIISGDEDRIVNSVSRVLQNKCESTSEELLLNMIVSNCAKRGNSDRMMFYKVTKALLNPSLKIIRVMPDEDLSNLKANI